MESIIRGTPLMRRCSDDWVNATQILKVAQFPKAQRTKILEKQVHQFTHEKIQGGYGRFQGTWVPLDIAQQLAESNGIKRDEAPILYYKADESTPLPRKSASEIRSAKKTTSLGALGEESPLKRRKKRQQDQHSVSANSSFDASTPVSFQHPPFHGQFQYSQNGTYPFPQQSQQYPYQMPPQMPFPVPPQPVMIPSHIHNRVQPPQKPYNNSQGSVSTENWSPDDHPFTLQRKNSDTSVSSNSSAKATMPPPPVPQAPQQMVDYADELIRFFSEENGSVPSFITSPPADFNINMAIDEEGHTALHWASSIASADVIEVFLSNGADPLAVNNLGLNSLSKLLFFNNSFEVKNFPALLKLLRNCLIVPDYNGRTPLHYLMELYQLGDSKLQPLEYYLSEIVRFISEAQRQAELADEKHKNKNLLRILINHQDVNGDSVLHVAIKSKANSFIKVLLTNGADLEIKNNQKLACKDMLSIELLEELQKEEFHKRKSQPKVHAPLTPSATHNEVTLQTPAGFNTSKMDTSQTTEVEEDDKENVFLDQNNNADFAVKPILESSPLTSSQSFHSKSQETNKRVCDIMSSVTDTYENELNDKEQELTHDTHLCKEIEQEISLLKEQNLSKMKALNLDPTEISSVKPILAAQIEKLNSTCEEKGQVLLNQWERSQALELAKRIHQEELLVVDEDVEPQRSHEAMKLSLELSFLQIQRRRQIDTIVNLLANAQGTNQVSSESKLYKYMKLISISCGLPVDDIDETLLGGIEHALVDGKSLELEHE